MRARLDHLSKHPDLSQMEPELLQQRQEEAHTLSERIALAAQICDELRRWMADIEAEEHKNHQQIKLLEADLNEVLPALGYSIDPPSEPIEDNFVTLPMSLKDPSQGLNRETAH